MSKIVPSSGLGLGPDEVGQKGLKLLHCDVNHKKSESQNHFFNCGLEDLLSFLRVWTVL